MAIPADDCRRGRGQVRRTFLLRREVRLQNVIGYQPKGAGLASFLHSRNRGRRRLECTQRDLRCLAQCMRVVPRSRCAHRLGGGRAEARRRDADRTLSHWYLCRSHLPFWALCSSYPLLCYTCALRSRGSPACQRRRAGTCGVRAPSTAAQRPRARWGHPRRSRVARGSPGFPRTRGDRWLSRTRFGREAYTYSSTARSTRCRLRPTLDWAVFPSEADTR
jgi:hypothetical protein